MDEPKVPNAESSSLTKAELAEVIYERIGLNKREARDLVDCFFTEIRETLMEGDSLKMTGFGHFVLRDKPQRPGRNPRTGEPVAITARRVVTFNASQKLRAQVQAQSLLAGPDETGDSADDEV